MLEHRIPYFRPLDRGHTDCDPKWRCVGVHEDTIAFFHSDVTSFAGPVLVPYLFLQNYAKVKIFFLDRDVI